MTFCDNRKCIEMKNMTNEQINFLKLVSCGLHQSECDEKLYVDEKVEELVSLHRCETFAYIGAKKNNISFPQIWKYKTLYGAIDTEKKLLVQTRITDALDNACIDYAILKGTSVARYYDIKGTRLLGDIDILVRESDYEKTIHILSPGTSLEANKHEFHFAIDIDGVSVEIHRHVTHRTDGKYNKKIFDMMSKALDETDIAYYEGHKFRVLKNHYQALVLLLHKRRHMDESKFVLRLVCDWAYFVKNVSEKEYKTKVYPFIKDAGLHLYADALTICTVKYLNFDNSDKIVANIDNDVADGLMSVLISGGVGKSEDSLTVGIGSIYARNWRNSNKFIAVIKSLNEIALRQFRFAKFKILLPVFWIYIPLRYVFRLITGKREQIDVSVFVDTVDKRKSVYHSLNLDNE